MRLFLALWRQNKPPGHIYRGKNRLSKPVTTSDVRKLRDKFEIEEKNMFYLRHSFLTPEQSYGHAKALGKHDENYPKLLQKKHEEKPFKDNITVETVLGHLRHKEAWD